MFIIFGRKVCGRPTFTPLCDPWFLSKPWRATYVLLNSAKVFIPQDFGISASRISFLFQPQAAYHIEVDLWCWGMRNGSQLELQQFIQKVTGLSSGLCLAAWKFFHSIKTQKKTLWIFHRRGPNTSGHVVYFPFFLSQVGSLCFTLDGTEAPFLSFIIASGGGAPLKIVLPPLTCALGEPLVVVFEGQSAGHAVCIPQQSVDVCKSNAPSVKLKKTQIFCEDKLDSS